MAKIRKNEMTVSYTVKTPKGEIEKEHKIRWTFSTDPIKWSVETLHSFMYCGLTQATKAILRAKVLQEVPAVELFNSMKPALLAMASGSTNPDAFKIFVQTMKEQGHVMQEELTTQFMLSEADFAPDNPQLVQAEATEDEDKEGEEESEDSKNTEEEN